MDWDKITYIFQIPLGWFKKISNKVFNAYGSNFINVKQEGYYGGLEVGIDEDAFGDAVKTAVDGQFVTIDTTQTVTGEKTFQNYLNVSNGNSSKDASIYIDNSGQLNVEQGTRTIVETPVVNLKNTQNDGHIDIDSRYGSLEIYTYEGRGGGGYIDFHTDGSTVDWNSRIIDTANEFSIRGMDKPVHVYSYYQSTANASGIVISSVNGDYKQLLTNEPARLYSTGADNQIASRGYCRINFSRSNHTHGNLSNDGRITNAGDGSSFSYYIAADAEGNLYRRSTDDIDPDLSDYATKSWVESKQYVTGSVLATTLQDYATNAQLQNYATLSWVEAQGFITETDLSSYATQSWVQSQNYVSDSDLQNYATTSDLEDLADDVTELSTDVELLKLDQIKSVDGHFPDLNGAVSFSLAGSKWLKSDANGHITTTNDTPVTVNQQSSGYLFNNAGTLAYDSLTPSKFVKTDSSGRLTTTNDDYVTIDSNQTITSCKTFSGVGNDVVASGGATIQASGSSNWSQMSPSTIGAYTSTQEVSISTTLPTLKLQYDSLNLATLIRGGSNLGLYIQDTSKITLDALANNVVLNNTPTDTSTSSKAVATVGYVQSKCVTLDKTQYTPVTQNITLVTDVVWDGTTLQKKTKQLNFNNGVLVQVGSETTTTIDTPVAYSTT